MTILKDNSLVNRAMRGRERLNYGRSRHATCRNFSRRRISIIGSTADSSAGSNNKLAKIIKRKHKEIEARLDELGMEGLEQRLQTAGETQAPQPFRFSMRIADVVQRGKPALAFEVSRKSLPGKKPGLEEDREGGLQGALDAEVTSQELAKLAQRLEKAGADAIIVPTDAEDTPAGLNDLFTVCRSVQIPVLQRDWILHPLQIAEAKESGCSGVIGVITSVTGKGTPILSSYASALGLDCPVEIVNMSELQSLEPYEVPFYGLNISIGLSVSIAGFGADVAEGLLGQFPFGILSIAGAGSIDEARKMRFSGADSLLIKDTLVKQWLGKEGELVQLLWDATSGDD